MTPAPHGSPPRPRATLSLDLDDVWAYLRTRGDADWESAPSMLPVAVDRLLPALAALDVRITVFVIGRDLTRPEGVEAVRALSVAGHEIASHSWLHRPDLSSLPAGAIADDLERTSDAIAEVVGERPTGFRCPSFGFSRSLLQALLDGGYRFDASVLPTSLAPLLRLYYRTRLRRGDAAATGAMFGPVSGAVRPLTPFEWVSPAGALLELPVSTFPLVRTPMHMSYLQALAERSEPAATSYLRGGLWALRRRGVPPSFLLHPTDLVDRRDAPRLDFFPGMRRPAAAKLDTVVDALARLSDRFDVVPLGVAAADLQGERLPRRSPGTLLATRAAAGAAGAAHASGAARPSGTSEP